MEPGVLSIRTGTSGLRWTPSTSPCSLESSCRAETPSGGQVVSGLKSEEFLFQSAAKTTQKIKSCWQDDGTFTEWTHRHIEHLKMDGYLVLVGLHYSWDWVHTYKVQLSNDSVNWKTCMNGTNEAVRTTFCILWYEECSTYRDRWTSHRLKTDFEEFVPNQNMYCKQNSEPLLQNKREPGICGRYNISLTLIKKYSLCMSVTNLCLWNDKIKLKYTLMKAATFSWKYKEM